MYYSHNSNIKCVGLVIKCIGFEPIDYAINLNVVSSSMVFNDFDYIFIDSLNQSNYFSLQNKINNNFSF